MIGLDREGRTLEPEFLDGDFLEQVILGERLLPRSRRIHLGRKNSGDKIITTSASLSYSMNIVDATNFYPYLLYHNLSHSRS